MAQMIHHKLNSLAARVLALAIAGFTATFVLFAPASLASRVAGDSVAADALNIAILAVCAAGVADVIWHDIMGRLIWPSLSQQIRHHICVCTYAALAGLTGVRAFVAAGADSWEVALLGVYYIVCAAGIALVAVAIALDSSHGTH